MSSRGVLAALLSVVMILSGSSCGLHTGEESPQAPPPSYSGAGFQCIGQITGHLEDYIFDRLASEEVTTFMTCLQRALTAFAQFTRGRDETTYAPDEIRRFLETYFIKTKHISDELLHEFMVIKATFIGGNVNRISRQELYVAVEILEDLRKEALRIKPFLKTLNPVLARQQPPHLVGRNIREAYAALNESIGVISRRFQANHQDYPLANLRSFVIQFRRLIGWEQEFPDSVSVAKWIEFVRVFKELSVAPEDSDKIRPRDWVPLLQSLSRWYLVYLEFEVGVRDQPKFQGVGLQNTLHLAQNMFTLAEEALSRQRGLTMTHAQMMSLLRALANVRWIPAQWRLRSMEAALTAIVGRVFGDPEIPLDQRTNSGFSMRTLARVKDAFYQWAYVQMNLEQEFGGSTVESVVPSLLADTLPMVDPEQPLILNNPDWVEFLKVRDHMRPLFSKDSNTIVVAPASKLAALNVEHGFHNLSHMNLLRSIVGMIFKGYSSDSASRVSWTSGLKREEMVRFYDDFREIGIDLGYVDPRNTKTGSRVFIEGNLFTYAANGLVPNATDARGKMSFTEGIQLVAFLFSGGTLSGKLYRDLAETCRSGPLDINRKPKLERACVEARLPEIIDREFGVLPEFHRLYGATAPAMRARYAMNLLETAYSPVNSHPDWVELSELSTLAVVSHYAEAVMTRFDVDESGTLTNDEIEFATPHFRGFIQWVAAEKMGKELSEDDAEAVFNYILAYKTLPADFWDEIWVWWISWTGYPTMEVNRYDLSEVFKVIISKLSEGQKPGEENPKEVQSAQAVPIPGRKPEPRPEPESPLPAADCRGIMDAFMRPECEGMQQIDGD